MTTAEDKPLDLVGLTEIAELCGVGPQTPYRWRTRHVLPDPEWTVSGSPVWRRAVIVEWARASGRLADQT